MSFFANSPYSSRAHRNCTADAHHIDLSTCVESEHLRYTRHLCRRQTQSDCDDRMLLKCNEPYIKNGGLQKSSQAGRDYLLAPANEAVCIPTGNTEHIQRTDSYLTEQDTSALHICKYYLYYAVSERNNEEQA